MTLENIHDPDVHWSVWNSFEHTANGYELQGRFKSFAELTNGKEAKTLTKLRSALLLEPRRDRHSGGRSTDESLIRELLGAILQKLEARELQ